MTPPPLVAEPAVLPRRFAAVARVTKRLEVAPVVCATLSKRSDMINVTGLLTTLHTERIGLEVRRSYVSPLGIIATRRRRGTIVWLSVWLVMGGAVPAIAGAVGATTHCTWLGRFRWHKQKPGHEQKRLLYSWPGGRTQGVNRLFSCCHYTTFVKMMSSRPQSNNLCFRTENHIGPQFVFV